MNADRAPEAEVASLPCGDPGEGWRSGPQSSWAEVSYCVIWVPVDVLSTPEASPEVLLSATEPGLCASLLLLPSASSQLLRDSLAALLDLNAFLETASLALRPSKQQDPTRLPSRIQGGALVTLLLGLAASVGPPLCRQGSCLHWRAGSSRGR